MSYLKNISIVKSRSVVGQCSDALSVDSTLRSTGCDLSMLGVHVHAWGAGLQNDLSYAYMLKANISTDWTINSLMIQSNE